MNKVVPITKPLGLTPLDAIRLFKERNPDYASETISYAGRLDPMADGLLLLLIGDANKERKAYEALEKTYRFQILFGVATDTYDPLGIVLSKPIGLTPHRDAIEEVLGSFVGTRQQSYPPYSSRTVQGKPLYWWARHNRLQEISIPTKAITISHCELLALTSTDTATLESTIKQRIGLVKGDFRQEAILSAWSHFFDQCKYTNIFALTVATAQVVCSSGTYVRSIAHELGKQIGNGALAFSITRTQVGSYSLETAIHL